MSLRQSLVSELRRAGALATPSVVRAMLAVPRHLFVPGVPIEEAYRDRAIMTKSINGVPVSSISQPAIVAIMLDQLGVQPGMNVLEIGAGTGYNAALLAELAGPEGRVTTIDIDADIVDAARAHLYSAGYDGVQVMLGDGGDGAPAGAPYDRIMLTVGAWDISPAWYDQLAPGGVLVLPLFLGVRQFAVAFEKRADGLQSRDMRACGFMHLRGAYAGPPLLTAAGDIQFGGTAIAQFDPTLARRTLELLPHVHILPDPLRTLDLIDFMALHDELVCLVLTTGEGLAAGPAYALITDEGRSIVWIPFGTVDNRDAMPEVAIYGNNSAWQRLLEQLRAFEAAGRPCLERARVSALPRDPSSGVGPGVLLKTWMAYQIRYP